jgi:hypothetical protein
MAMKDVTIYAIPFGIVAYIFVVVIYRLCFHPLRNIPGPKLAAVTHLYEFYYTLVKGGMFIWETKRMHEKYGTSGKIRNDALPG